MKNFGAGKIAQQFCQPFRTIVIVTSTVISLLQNCYNYKMSICTNLLNCSLCMFYGDGSKQLSCLPMHQFEDNLVQYRIMLSLGHG